MTLLFGIMNVSVSHGGLESICLLHLCVVSVCSVPLTVFKAVLLFSGIFWLFWGERKRKGMRESERQRERERQRGGRKRSRKQKGPCNYGISPLLLSLGNPISASLWVELEAH